MPINLKNFINSQLSKTIMNDFQDLEHIDGLSISTVSANLYDTPRDDLVMFILGMEQITPLFIQSQK